MIGKRKKEKANKSKGTEAFVLTDGGINKIKEKVKDIIVETWDRIDDRYRTILVEVQQGIVELKAFSKVAK